MFTKDICIGPMQALDHVSLLLIKGQSSPSLNKMSGMFMFTRSGRRSVSLCFSLEFTVASVPGKEKTRLLLLPQGKADL